MSELFWADEVSEIFHFLKETKNILTWFESKALYKQKSTSINRGMSLETISEFTMTESFLYFSYIVQFFPREEFNFFSLQFFRQEKQMFFPLFRAYDPCDHRQRFHYK